MKTFKLIIFDLDGTLVNSYPAIISSVNYTLKRLGLAPLPAPKIKRAVGWGDKELLRPFIGNHNVEEALQKLYRPHHARSLRRKISFMPYAKQLLRYLDKRGYIMAIASNRPNRFTRIILRHLRIEKYFRYVLCKDQLTFGKPHPSILNKIIRKAGVAKKQVLYIGDMAIDVKTGKRAGVATVAVVTGSSSKAELSAEQPACLCKNLSGLMHIL